MSLFGTGRLCPMTILRAYKNGDYTDLKIICEPLTFDVHQVVVCTACDFFKQSLRFGKEAQEKCVDLPEDDPEMIRRLISYLYLGNYDPCDERGTKTFENIKQHDSTTPSAPAYHSRYHRTGGFGGGTDQCACLAPNPKNVKQPVSEPEPCKKPTDYVVLEKASTAIEVTNPLTIHATMYALADKYQVDALGQLAKDKFESCLFHHVNSEDFVNAVQIIFSTTPESNVGLRSVVVKAFLTYFRVDVTRIPGVEAKLESIDELSFLLIKSWPTKSQPPKEDSPFTKPTASNASGFGGFGLSTNTSGGLFGSSPATGGAASGFGSVPR